MADVGAALEVLGDILVQPNPVQALSDAKTTYAYYTAPATVEANLRAGKLASITGPVSRTLVLADKLANDPERAPHINALVQSLIPPAKS